jgi:hypothetical protein
MNIRLAARSIDRDRGFRAGSRHRLRRLLRAVRLAMLPILAPLVLLAGAASAQPGPEAPPPDADVLAFCTAWQLATKAVKLAHELTSTAADRLDWARARVQECKAGSHCGREEQLNFEQEVREAGYQRSRAAELATAMEQRQAVLRTRFEQLRGEGAANRCAGG